MLWDAEKHWGRAQKLNSLAEILENLTVQEERNTIQIP